MKLYNKTILITGGSSGIGLEFAKQLRQRNNKIIVTGRNFEKLNRIMTDDPGIETIQSDVSLIENVVVLYKRIITEFPDLSVLINNAGIGKTIDLQEQQSPNFLNEEVAVNLLGPIQMINQFLPHLMSKNEAAIINVTSALAYSPFPIVPIYSATKAGLHSYTMSLRVQLRKTHVKVFEIAPPTTQTEMIKGFGDGQLKGARVMESGELVKVCLSKIDDGQEEICPGQAGQLKFMSRLAPQYTIRKMRGRLYQKTT